MSDLIEIMHQTAGMARVDAFLSKLFDDYGFSFITESVADAEDKADSDHLKEISQKLISMLNEIEREANRKKIEIISPSEEEGELYPAKIDALVKLYSMVHYFLAISINRILASAARMQLTKT